MRLAPFLIAVLGLATVAQAQPVPGSCDLGTASGVLDANDVRARVFNIGSLFFGNGFEAEYVVPKDQEFCSDFRGCWPPSPLYAASLWIGGKVEGELRVAGATYRNFEFWPGPLDADGRPPDPADCSPYDRIFTVSRADVRRYLETGEATDDLRDWPVDWGAPVLDGDGIEGNYDLSAGDQPAISGDQTAWWVMNDVGNEHLFMETPPVGLEVEAEVFAAARPNAEGLRSVERTTFYRYRITYRGDAPLDSAYVTVFADPDLGNASDDYIGADTTLDLAFVYNGRDEDGVYGVPPALGFRVLQGPVALPNGRDDDGDRETDEAGERHGLTAFGYPIGFSGTDDPTNGEEAYNRMQGLWNNGVPLTEGGFGYLTNGRVTTFAFPGDPVEERFWSEVNRNGEGNDNALGDRQFFLSMGPFRMEPGETEEVVLALVFAQGGTNISSVAVLRTASSQIALFYEGGAFEPSRVTPAQPEPPEAPDLPDGYALAVFPNPLTASSSVRFDLPVSDEVRVALYDMLGREVAVFAEGTREAGSYTARFGRLAPGVYVLRADLGRGVEVNRKLTVLR